MGVLHELLTYTCRVRCTKPLPTSAKWRKIQRMRWHSAWHTCGFFRALFSVMQHQLPYDLGGCWRPGRKEHFVHLEKEMQAMSAADMPESERWRQAVRQEWADTDVIATWRKWYSQAPSALSYRPKESAPRGSR